MCQSILAQIDTSGNWYSGQLLFSARNIGNGQVLMTIFTRPVEGVNN